jgi:hypothetical protein
VYIEYTEYSVYSIYGDRYRIEAITRTRKERYASYFAVSFIIVAIVQGFANC